MLKKLSTKTNFILIGIVVGLFVGVSIRQALGDTTDTSGTARADNLTVNMSANAGNGLIVAAGNALVAGNIGVGTTTPTAKLDVVGDIKSATQLCVGATCVNESELQAMKNQIQTTIAHPGMTMIHLTKRGSGTVKADGYMLSFEQDGTLSRVFYDNELPKTVSLVSTPDSGYKFVKWSGGCSGTGDTCSISLKAGEDADINVTMEFATVDIPTLYILAVIKDGTGTGTVVSTPIGINCGSACAHTFPSGTSVILTATPASGSTFAGWSDACSGTSTSCTVVMSSAKNVRATFTSGTGGGVVTPGTMTGTGTVSDPYMCPVVYEAGIQSPVDCKNDPAIKQGCCSTGTITSCKAVAGGSSLVGTGCHYIPPESQPQKHLGAAVDHGLEYIPYAIAYLGAADSSARPVGSNCTYDNEFYHDPITVSGVPHTLVKFLTGAECGNAGSSCFQGHRSTQACQ